MSSTLFNIKDLACSYSGNPDDKVLFIEELVIMPGEIVFLLGASGSGKSTLLETLGLMNNTIAEGSVRFTDFQSGNSFSFEKLWSENDYASIATVRKSHFSFIFQNTNLMDNFTAYENICLSKMIQQDVQQQDAVESAKALMGKVGLPESTVTLNTISVNLSGGQRQRIAFVRALNAGFSVLFGDEPTGNLDEKNANELMGIVASSLPKDATAIFVSHDINLALNNATKIICLSVEEGRGYGEIKKENIFTKDQWQNKNPSELAEFRKRLRSFYDTRLTKSARTDVPAKAAARLDQNFDSLFMAREGAALSGKGWANFLIFSLLLLSTFLAIGFANGSISYLETKVKNPFVNWLNIPVPGSKAGSVPEHLEILNDPELKEKYKFETVTSYIEMPLLIWNRAEEQLLPKRGRTISMDVEGEPDPILKEILSPKNLVEGNSQDTAFSGDKDLSVIVTKKLMEEFQYPPDTPFITVGFLDPASEESRYLPAPIAVRAVVNEMPGRMYIAYTPYFLSAYMAHGLEQPFYTRNKKNIKLFITGDRQLANQVHKSIGAFFEQGAYSQYSPAADPPVASNESHMEAHTVIIDFWDTPPSDSLDSIFAKLMTLPDIQKHKNKISRTYSYEASTVDADEGYPDAITVNFKELDSVRAFSDYIYSHFNEKDDKVLIEADMGAVKEKENFFFLYKIAYAISGLILIFATFGVSLFVINLLKMHLGKVKMNIGTFTAFGLSSNKAQSIYFIIILRFIVLSAALSFAAAYGLGFTLDKLFSRWWKVEEGFSYFKLIDPVTLIALLVILSVSIAVSWVTIRKMLSKTPGDLIYNR